MVQGYAWFPKFAYQNVEAEAEDPLPVDDVLCAYVGMMNSSRFGSVIEMFSPHVVGGQFNLSPRYVRHIPVPNLVDLAGDERLGNLISRLAKLGGAPRVNERAWSESVDRITMELYGPDFFDRV